MKLRFNRKNSEKVSWRARLQSLGLLLGVILILVAASELTLRLVAPRTDAGIPGATNLGTLQQRSEIPGLFWEGTPGFSSPEYTLNSAGFRGAEFPETKTDTTIRVALIGDSITFGLGVHEADSIYAARLARSLRDYGDYQILNFGVPGYNTWQEAVQLQKVVLQHKPDLVVLGFFFNDMDGLTMMATADGLQQTAAGDSGAAPAVSQSAFSFLKQSYFVRGVKQVVEQIGFRLFGYYPNYMDMKIKSGHWRAMKDKLLEIKTLLDAQEIPFVVVVFPVSYQLSGPAAESAAQQDLLAFLRTNEFRYLDMFGPFQQFLRANAMDFRKLLVKGVPDSHPTAEGHRLVAEELEGYLVRNQILAELEGKKGAAAASN